MTNEEFQKLVLDKLNKNDEFQKIALEKFDNLEKEIMEVKTELQEVKEIVLRTEEQAKNLTEFKQTIKDSAFDLAKKIS